MTAARSALLPLVLFAGLAGSAPAVADEVAKRADGELVVVDGEHGEAHAEEHEDGLPANPSPDLALWTGIVFLLFLAALWFLAWKPVTSGLDKREERIRGDLAAAEKHRVESERLMSQHSAEMANAQEQVKEILAEARRDAEVAAQNVREKAQAEIRAERDRTLHDIEQAKAQAQAELFETFNDQLAAATEQVLGRNLTDETQQRLIDQSIAEFRGSRA